MINETIEQIRKNIVALKKAISENEHSEIAFCISQIHHYADILQLEKSSENIIPFKEEIKTLMEDFKIASNAISQLKAINEKHLKRLIGEDLTYAKPN